MNEMTKKILVVDRKFDEGYLDLGVKSLQRSGFDVDYDSISRLESRLNFEEYKMIIIHPIHGHIKYNLDRIIGDKTYRQNLPILICSALALNESEDKSPTFSDGDLLFAKDKSGVYYTWTSNACHLSEIVEEILNNIKLKIN